MSDSTKRRVMRRVPLYIAPDGTRIEFHRIDNAPGWTHRVIINGAARDWFSPVKNGAPKPNVRVARFYYDKHCRQVLAA